MPVKPPDKDGEDKNKLPRAFQDLLDEYARAYDNWCQAHAEVEQSFSAFKEKQQKYDRLVKEFPSNLVTPIDADYLKKILRRARQNKHKRSRTAATKVVKGDENIKPKEEAASDQDEEEEALTPKGREIHMPTKGMDYQSLHLIEEDFAL